MQILIIGTALPKNTLKTKKQALMGLGLNDLTQDYAHEADMGSFVDIADVLPLIRHQQG